jgi:catechol 2,3-dioxygenase-like lactoylglutathione lyase family enzyme
MASDKVDGLAVVLLLSNDTERTAAFYRDVLGLALIAEQHGGRHRHYACRTGSVYFTIQYTGDLYGQEPPRAGDTTQLCFAVADMDAFLRRLEGSRVKPLHPAMPFEHTTFVTLCDPDGRSVRVMTPWQR